MFTFSGLWGISVVSLRNMTDVNIYVFKSYLGSTVFMYFCIQKWIAIVTSRNKNFDAFFFLGR